MSLMLSVGVIIWWLVLLGPRAVLSEAPQMDAVAQAAVHKYVTASANHAEAETQQGVWIQSEHAVLAQYQGTVPLPVASLTKIATTLAALHVWGPTHQFETMVYTTGPVRHGVVQGDLVVRGGGDPFFVSEDVTELRRTLRQIGIKRVTGKLLIIGDFAMNFTTNPLLAGKLLRQALHAGGGVAAPQGKGRKASTAKPAGTSVPTVAIVGSVQIVAALDGRHTPILRHYSLPLVQILKRMNVYSNNAMADMLTRALGGVEIMIQQAARAAGVTPAALSLINGSGLGADNLLSPRTVCALLVAMHNLLRPTEFTIADVFPVAGHDQGTIRRRHLPQDAVVKTGTLRNVATLAGVILTRAHGPVWFTLVNQGNDLGGYRAQQDVLLRSLMRHWGTIERPPSAFSPTQTLTSKTRNDILLGTKAGVQETPKAS
jgi:D-alanyl-D-alanine carboxypeptidase/D-alanyl-D-alanine-endopeptidase (penicillin-binding protein 4)